MKTLIKNGEILNVFEEKLEKANILIEDERIIEVSATCADENVDQIIDASGKVVVPSFVDAHIHIESTMLTPKAFAKICIPHGTGSVVADPHEIANVCGTDGVEFMRQESKNLPINLYYVMPSCVPASPFDENGATITAKDIKPFYKYEDILGLGEVMNYPGVIAGDKELLQMIQDAKDCGKVVEGHAPFVTGEELDKYINAGIQDDHECSTMEEALEKLRKGMKILIRQGSSARNLNDLVDLLDTEYARSCCFATDDKEAKDLVRDGHIDAILRQVIQKGKDPILAYVNASHRACLLFKIQNQGAIAPGYFANFLILNDFEKVDIQDVYFNGKLVCEGGDLVADFNGQADEELAKKIRGTFNVRTLNSEDFYVEPRNGKCRIIKAIEGQLITESFTKELNFENNNGVDIGQDIIKLAVIERHKGTGHIGLGYIQGIGIQEGAFAQSIAHDSHNLIVAGTNQEDMAIAANHVVKQKGGICIVKNGQILADVPLPVAGIMSDDEPENVINALEILEEQTKKIGSNIEGNIISKLSFMALPVIPALKMTTKGLVDVVKFEEVPLFANE